MQSYCNDVHCCVAYFKKRNNDSHIKWKKDLVLLHFFFFFNRLVQIICRCQKYLHFHFEDQPLEFMSGENVEGHLNCKNIQEKKIINFIYKAERWLLWQIKATFLNTGLYGKIVLGDRATLFLNPCIMAPSCGPVPSCNNQPTVA